MTGSDVGRKLKELGGVLGIAPCVAGLVVALSFTGILQNLEWSVVDYWFQLRPTEQKDSRIVVVEVQESDIAKLQQWPMDDGILATLLSTIKQQEPRVIGIDIYRDIRLGDQQEQRRLDEVFRSSDKIIGIEKAIGERVAPPPVLEELGQVAMADLVLDMDGKVRRALISAEFDDGEVVLSLGALTALIYLEADNVLLENSADSEAKLLGEAAISALNRNSAVYIGANTGGFQTLLNYRGKDESFIHLSLVDVLERKIPEDVFHDRLVLIGAVAPSLNDFFYTPYSTGGGSATQMPGVYVHANIASQLISGALDGRNLIKGISEVGEWAWIFGWSMVGGVLSLILFKLNLWQKDALNSLKLTFVGIVIPIGCLFTSSYLLFLGGYWLPTMAPLSALVISNLAVTGFYYQNQKKIAFTDGLTKIANRRFFDHFMEQQWSKCQKEKKDLALILCDVDFFKIYNDTYGHQAGDICLQKVALALDSSVRSTDLAARYGGEEFAVVLPDSNPDTALLVAQRINSKLAGMEIPHAGSQASEYVSISMGIASQHHSQVISVIELQEAADQALYQAKKQGRDRAIVHKPEFGSQEHN